MAGARSASRRCAAEAASGGFTLIELLVTCAILSLIFAIVAPNLGALVPAARLDGSGAEIRRQLDWVRSEARIQGKRMVMEFDIDRSIWRLVYPPEQRLTRDDDVSELEERPEDWRRLEPDVRFVGIGDGKNGLASRGVYRLVFDEYGFTGDQVIVIALESDPDLTWTMTIQGLSGRVDVHRSETGEKPLPQVPNEGAF